MSRKYPSAKALLVLESEGEQDIATISKAVSSFARQVLTDVLSDRNGFENKPRIK